MEKLKQLRHFIFDIDGVLTPGSVLVTEEGQMLRTVNIKDGYALQHAIKQGFEIAIISGGKSEGMRKRFEGLGLKHIFLGQSNKVEAFETLKKTWNVTDDEIAYCGDDMPDFPLLQKVGLSTCPADAAQDIKDICELILPVDGGKGCARFILETAMKLQDCWLDKETFSW